MVIIRARTAGFCMGVDLALRKLDKALATSGGPLYTLGPIIHNPQVLLDYEARGVGRLDSLERLEELGPEDRVAVRAHGVPQAVERRILATGARVIDATCPRVKKAQLLIAEHASKDRRLILFGELDHPEVKGLLSYAHDEAHVVGSLEEFDDLQLSSDVGYYLAAQTTQDREAYERLGEKAEKRLGEDTPVLNTICDATRQRQAEAIELADAVDVMVVAGGYESGNTRRLALVAQARGVPCHHVETAAELPMDALRVHARAGDRVGLTAGASTPKDTIDAIEEALKAL